MIEKLDEYRFTIPKVGQTAIVRNRPAIVRDVSVARSVDQEIVHGVLVEYIDGYSHPSEDFVLWERELRAELLSSAKIPDLLSTNNVDQPDIFRAFVNSYRWTAINRIEHLSADAKLQKIVSPWLSAVQIEDYQLYPVLKALSMPRITLLLADDVGLGKTIEAGLILNELVARGRLRRILIICPASLQIQWRDEMAEKFFLNFAVVNGDSTLELQKEYGVDSNPWSFHSRIITSIDYLRQRDVLESFESASRSFAQSSSTLSSWEMLIVDEAHNIAPKHFGEDTERLKMVRQIIPHFEHRLFLTATPHNGYTESFTGLLETLNPLVFEQKTELEPSDIGFIGQHVVRRLKSEFQVEGGVQRFCKRTIHRINEDQRLPEIEKNLFDALRRYREKARQIVEDETVSRRFIIDFLITLLTKRLLSSHYAFAMTWWNHFAGMEETDIEQNEVDYAIGRAESDVTDDAERDLREEEAARKIGTWFSRHTSKLKKEIDTINRALETIGWGREDVAAELTPQGLSSLADSKWESIVAWVKTRLQSGNKLRDDERVIIFTEYKHTLDYLEKRFEAIGFKNPVLQTLVGGSKESAREQVKAHFNDSASPLRILLVTDVASEGINLQNNCRFVIHFEIPWNPMRLEQRNGRVDRFGQSRDVMVFHYVTEDEEDFKFLERVVHKVEQIREDLGKVSELLDRSITMYFVGKKEEREEAQLSVENLTPATHEKGLMLTPDKGGKDQYEMALQLLRSSELELDLNPQSLANLLQHAFAVEGGELAPHPTEEGIYEIRRQPARWRSTIEDTLEIKSGRLAGALPHLVFNPDYFRRLDGDRLQYVTKPDTRLVRIGHPLVRKAINLFKKSLWSVQGGNAGRAIVNRIAFGVADLPSGLNEIAVLFALVECYNELKESVHEQVLAIPVVVDGTKLIPVLPDIWARVENSTVLPMETKSLQEWMPRIKKQWTVLQDHFNSEMAEKRKKLRKEFEAQLSKVHKTEEARVKKSYQQRLEELKHRTEADYVSRQRNQMNKERIELQQATLFAHTERERADRLREIDANLEKLIGTKVEYLQSVLKQEMERTLNLVIPKRFSIGYLDLQPLGVEVLLNKNLFKK
jgi:SNF2 family DNA or RNA helicase